MKKVSYKRLKELADFECTSTEVRKICLELALMRKYMAQVFTTKRLQELVEGNLR